MNFRRQSLQKRILRIPICLVTLDPFPVVRDDPQYGHFQGLPLGISHHLRDTLEGPAYKNLPISRTRKGSDQPRRIDNYKKDKSHRAPMRPWTLWRDWLEADTIENLLPDFILAFTFFTALVYAVLGKRFEQQRPAIAMSAAMGFALSVGLVWWERSNGFSIRDLGPIAIGFSIIILAFVMYQSIRQVGGSWAGAGIALGASILIAEILGMNLVVSNQIIQTTIVVALIMGVMAFLHHQHVHPSSPRLRAIRPENKPDMSRLFRERHLSHALERRLNGIKRRSETLNEHPEAASDIVQQIRRMLPAEGYLTERMARLRAKAHQVRNGHIARIEETRHVFAKLPTSAKKKAAAELAAGYNQIIGIDTRLERLDEAIAENEKRIRELTQKAQDRATGYDHRGLTDCLKHAEKLQKHNSHLFKTIERTEAKLTALAKQVAAQARRMDGE